MNTVSYYVKPKLVQQTLKSKTEENKVSSEASKVKKATYFKNTFQRYDY
jgi:hypothetical protein